MVVSECDVVLLIPPLKMKARLLRENCSALKSDPSGFGGGWMGTSWKAMIFSKPLVFESINWPRKSECRKVFKVFNHGNHRKQARKPRSCANSKLCPPTHRMTTTSEDTEAISLAIYKVYLPVSLAANSVHTCKSL